MLHGAVLAAEASGPPPFLGPTAALVVAAAVIGYLSVRVRVVPIVGFLLAGVLIGPAQLGVVQRQETVEAAAEIGVILLLFTIGIEFSLERLARIRRWILVGGGLQVGVTCGLVVAVLALAGVDWRTGLFTGFLVALSSTAIVLKLLGDAGETSTTRGQLALAVLIFQDLAVVLMVLVVPLLGVSAQGSGAGPLLLALAKAAGIIALVLVLARRVMPPLLEQVARVCSPEVFLLAIVAICIGTAYLTALAGVSVSLGAFLAGLVVSESRQSSHALGEVLPLQTIFSAVFFVSVGMLLDVGFVLDNLPLVLLALAAVLLVKVVAGLVATSALRVGAGPAVGAALVLAQVGEFSFVLETAGRSAGLTPAGLGTEGTQVFIAVTVLLMVATPLLAAAGRRVEHALGVRRAAARAARGLSHPAGAGPRGDDAGEGELTDHVVISGWGQASGALADELSARGVPLVVLTLNPDGAADAERRGHRVVRGDSTKSHILAEAGVRRARAVVVADDGPEHAARITAVVANLAPEAVIVVRPVGDADVDELAAAGAHKVVDAERASHAALARTVLDSVRGTSPVVDTTAVLRFPLPASSPCPHASSAVRAVLPGSEGCAECLRTGARWVHLRICLTCGHVGCCDSSPGRHARAHADAEGHPVIASLEPGEHWAYCLLDDTTIHAGPAAEVTR